MKYIITSLFIFIGFGLFGQQFLAQTNRDTVLIGNTFSLDYIVENVEGEFDGPNLEQLPVVSGPNTSMSLNIINGVTTQKQTYSYIIKPVEEGVIEIEPGYLVTQDSTFETAPLLIYVEPNPDGIIQQDNTRLDNGFFNMNPFGSFQTPKKKEVKPKSKRKLKRI